MFSMYNRIGKQLSRPMILAQPRACFSFGQIRKKDENGNIIEPETEEEAKPAELTPEQQAAIQKVIRARIESQLKEAYKKVDPDGAALLDSSAVTSNKETQSQEPQFNVTMSQLQSIRQMEYEIADLKAKVRQSELFKSQLKPVKDFGAHKNLPLFALVLAIIVFSMSIRLDAMNQAKNLVESECATKMSDMQDEAELAAQSATLSFEALALLKQGKSQQAEEALMKAGKHYQKYQERVRLRNLNEQATEKQQIS